VFGILAPKGLSQIRHWLEKRLWKEATIMDRKFSWPLLKGQRLYGKICHYPNGPVECADIMCLFDDETLN